MSVNDTTVPGEWSVDIAQYIKSVDSNHLVLDGSFPNEGYSKLALASEYIDMFTNHYYDRTQPSSPVSLSSSEVVRPRYREWTFRGRLQGDVELVSAYGKAFHVGEFGMQLVEKNRLRDVFDQVVANTNISGAMVWSLRFHSRDGGFCKILPSQ
jgi:endo-1,4-beta-mannosidase